jgi:hypothetical protein
MFFLIIAGPNSIFEEETCKEIGEFSKISNETLQRQKDAFLMII